MNQTNALKETQKIYMGVAFGLLIAASAVFYLIQTGIIEKNTEHMNWLFKAVPMSIVIGLSASFYLGNKHLKIARSAKGLPSKLRSFHTSTLIKNLCLAVPGLLACIAAILTGEAQFLFIALAVLMVMLIAFPSKNKAISLMELNEKDSKELEKISSN